MAICLSLQVPVTVVKEWLSLLSSDELMAKTMEIKHCKMGRYKLNTWTRFREATDEDKTYVLIKKGSTTCSSHVGYKCGINNWTDQSLYLSPDCYHNSYYVFAHEFLHAIGLLHEMCRPDRDDHITVLWDNINESCHSQFSIYNSETYGVPYDGRSIMHYTDGMCGNGKGHTMESKVCILG